MSQAICYLCQNEISGNGLYIGDGTYRHHECNPVEYSDVPADDKESEAKLWDELMQNADEIHHKRLRMVEILSIYHKNRLYRLRGFHTWNDFTAFLGMKRSWAYELLNIARNECVIEYVRDKPSLLDEKTKHLSAIAKIATDESIQGLMQKVNSMTLTDLKNDISTHPNTGLKIMSFTFTAEQLEVLEEAFEYLRTEHNITNKGEALSLACAEILNNK